MVDPSIEICIYESNNAEESCVEAIQDVDIPFRDLVGYEI